MAKHIIHAHSSAVVEGGGAKLPTPDQIEYGEIAINYSKGNESISIKNAEDEIITTNLNRGVGMSDPVSPSGTGEIFNSYIGSGCNSAFGAYSHAEGYGTLARGMYSHVEGGATSAIGDSSHAEGYGTIAKGKCSHAEGSGTTANGKASHAEGIATSAIGDASHAEGYTTKANGVHSHAEGYYTQARGGYSHAEGFRTIASGYYSHAEGYYTASDGESSHAEGYYTQANGESSHAEGRSTIASGENSHAEGYATSAIGDSSHAEGSGTTASERCSHAEGAGTIADGICSHAEGAGTIADGWYSHAEGGGTLARGNYSHTQNYQTTASAQTETAMGRYNTTNSSVNHSSTNIALSVGNGTSNTSRGNAFTVQFNGAVKGDMSYSTPAADYAEMFEWEDGNPDNEDRVGYFVTVSGKKIRKAVSSDEIVGIVSSTPGVIGNNPMRWNNKYANDEWGRPIYEEVEVPYTEMVKQEDGTMKEETVYRTEVHRKLNPEWRGEETFTERAERKEWAAVGLLGQILVRQDGTLNVGTKCTSNDNGIATKSDKGYIVLEIPNEGQALVLFR